MDPITLSVAGSFLLNGANSFIQTKSSVDNLKYQSQIKYRESAVIFQNAQKQAAANSYNEDLTRNEVAQRMATNQVRINESGLSGGTIEEYQMETEANAEADILMQRYNASSQYHALLYEAQKAKEEAVLYSKNANKANKMKWFNLLLGGASAAFGTAANAGELRK